MVLGAGLARPLNRAFFPLAAVELWWAVSSLLLRLALWSGLGNPTLLAHLVAMSWAAMGPCLLLFSAEYVGRRTRPLHLAVVGGGLFAAALLAPAFQGQLLSSPRIDITGTTLVDVSRLGMAAALVPSAFFLWALALFWRDRKRTGEPYLALSVLVLLVGFVTGEVLNVPFALSSVTQTLSVALLGYGVTSRQLFNPLRDRAAALQREVAERMRTEEALRASEQRFRTIFDSVHDAIMVHELESGRILDVNARMTELWGYGREQACGLEWEALSAGERPHTQHEAMRWMQRAAAGEPQLFEWLAKHRDGQRFWVEMNMRLATIGHDERLLVVARDISDRKRAEEERRQLEERMLHAQKLESLGVLAGGIAHDFNNLLCAMLGYADMAARAVRADSPTAEKLGRIRDAAVRASDLCRQMLAYAGKGQMSVEPVDLSRLVEEMGELLRASVAKSSYLRLRLEQELPPVKADPSQLGQIVLNLIVNASEALGNNPGRISLATGRTPCTRERLGEAYLGGALPPGPYVYLEVADTGCGMDEPTMGRLFDPFFTTKFAGRGLGLSAVLGIVRSHRGAIEVKSSPGQGSSFTLLLPAAAAETEPKREARAAVGPWRGSGTVLLVDDEPMMRAVGRALLETLGFDVLVAENGRVGTELYRANTDRIALVLLDLTMPELGGEQTFAHIRRIRPDARVLLMSGFGEKDALERFAGRGLAGFLQKPFALDDLAAKIQLALTTGGTSERPESPTSQAEASAPSGPPN
jgi:two-component system cell cycle sensor histidine kinase/response regulator CckA